MSELENHEIRQELSLLGFSDPKVFHADHWAALHLSGSFWSIVDGDSVALKIGYLNRWVYANKHKAMRALQNWSGYEKPTGWMSEHLSDAITMYP